MTSDWSTDYNARQYRRMADAIERFEQKASDLPTLVAAWESLLAVLEAPERHWVDQFRSEWGTLEATYALALSRVEDGLCPEVDTAILNPINQSLIKTAVNNLKHLLNEVGTESGNERPKRNEGDRNEG